MEADGAAAASAAAQPQPRRYYVRVVLLGSAGQGVLLERLGDSWDLPFFAYPSQVAIQQVCDDVRRALAPDSAYFIVNCNLIGISPYLGRPPTKDVGVANLLLMECQGHVLQASGPYSWRDTAFVDQLLKSGVKDWGAEKALEIVSKLLCRDPERLVAFLVDPRFLKGWFDKASARLTTFIASTGAIVRGRVVQVHVSFSSSVLKVESSTGVFYLKAVAIGSKEAKVTQKVASLFPEDAPAVEMLDLDLNCFVSRAFTPTLAGAEFSTYAQLLGRLQMRSIKHLDDLRAVGVPDCGPEQLAKELRKWVDLKEDDATVYPATATLPVHASDADIVRIWCGDVRKYARFVKYVPFLLQLCNRLASGSIPLTLVHGDVGRRNTGLSASDGASRPILFDWEFACIGHPFYDWHELHFAVPEEVRLSYLRLFTKYGAQSDLEPLYDAGRTLGWCVKMYHMLKRARLCDVELFSTHRLVFLDSWELLIESLMDVRLPLGVPQDEGPKWRYLT